MKADDILNNQEQYIAESLQGWPPDRHEDVRRIARSRIAAVRRADQMLIQATTGDLFWMEGSCPSGPTYSEQWTFNGSAAMRSNILETVLRLSYPDAWRSGLCHAKQGAEAHREEYCMGMRAAFTTHPPSFA